MKKFTKILIALFIFRLVLAFVVWHPDVNNHVDWGIRFWEYGPKQFYHGNIWNFTWPNQPPGTILLFAFVRKLFEAVFGVFWFVNVKIPAFPSIIITYFESNLYPALLQLPAILADFGIAYLIYKILKDWKNTKVAKAGALMFLINPVIWYNSAFWGQTDSIINFFALLAFYWLFRKKVNLSILAYLVCLYIKISLLIFAPIFFIIAIKKYKPIKLLKGGAISVGLLLLPTLLFADKNPIVWLFEIYKDKVLTQQLQVITANAFNIWAAIAGIHEQPHRLPFLGLTYQYWGYILFAVFFIPVLYLIWKKQTEKRAIWALAMTSFISWMFLTNMHERYLYPLFPYFTILAAFEVSLVTIYWIVSIISLLNLYNFWFTPRILFIENVMSAGDRLMPRVLGIINTVLFFMLYKRFLKDEK